MAPFSWAVACAAGGHQAEVGPELAAAAGVIPRIAAVMAAEAGVEVVGAVI